MDLSTHHIPPHPDPRSWTDLLARHQGVVDAEARSRAAWAAWAERRDAERERAWPDPAGTASSIAMLPRQLQRRAQIRWDEARTACQGAPLPDVPDIVSRFQATLTQTIKVSAALMAQGVTMDMDYQARAAAGSRWAAQCGRLNAVAYSDSQTIAPGAARAAAAALDRIMERAGLDSERAPHRARACDPGWWRGYLHRSVRPIIERAWLGLAPEHMRWISPDASTRAAGQRRRLQEWAEQHSIVDTTTGECVSMAAILKGKERRQYAEFLARAKGVGTLAEREGYEPVLVTLTAPGEMHAGTTVGVGGTRRPNPKWDGSTPADQHRWLSQRWRSYARGLHRHGVHYWTRTVQPHWDCSTHWHIVVWRPRRAEKWFERSARKIFEADTAAGSARYNHGIDFQTIKGGTQGAIGYVARALAYIARSVSEGKDRAEAEATAEWASVWGIRRFATSHDQVSVWRMLRRTDIDITPAGTDAADAQEAARRGDYATFLGFADRARIQVGYEIAQTQYGDATRRIVGVKVAGALFRRTRRWVSGANVPLIPKDQGPRTKDQGPRTKGPGPGGQWARKRAAKPLDTAGPPRQQRPRRSSASDSGVQTHPDRSPEGAGHPPSLPQKQGVYRVGQRGRQGTAHPGRWRYRLCGSGLNGGGCPDGGGGLTGSLRSPALRGASLRLTRRHPCRRGSCSAALPPG